MMLSPEINISNLLYLPVIINFYWNNQKFDKAVYEEKVFYHLLFFLPSKEIQYFMNKYHVFLNYIY